MSFLRLPRYWPLTWRAWATHISRVSSRIGSSSCRTSLEVFRLIRVHAFSVILAFLRWTVRSGPPGNGRNDLRFDPIVVVSFFASEVVDAIGLNVRWMRCELQTRVRFEYFDSGSSGGNINSSGGNIIRCFWYFLPVGWYSCERITIHRLSVESSRIGRMSGTMEAASKPIHGATVDQGLRSSPAWMTYPTLKFWANYWTERFRISTTWSVCTRPNAKGMRNWPTAWSKWGRRSNLRSLKKYELRPGSKNFAQARRATRYATSSPSLKDSAWSNTPPCRIATWMAIVQQHRVEDRSLVYSEQMIAIYNKRFSLTMTDFPGSCRTSSTGTFP